MPSKLMDALKLAAKWLCIEGVEGVSANEDEDCIEVYVLKITIKIEKEIPKIFRGCKVSILEVHE